MMNPQKTQTDLWALVQERRKVEELTLRATTAEGLLETSNAELANQRAIVAQLAVIAQRVKTAETTAQNLSVQLQSAQTRINGLLQVVQWARSRDTAWRGVAIETINKKLDEALNGQGT